MGTGRGWFASLASKDRKDSDATPQSKKSSIQKFWANWNSLSSTLNNDIVLTKNSELNQIET